MVKWLMRRGIAAFERQWNYDASCLHEMVEISPRAAWLFQRACRFTRATLDHDPSADQYRDEIIKRWGPRAVVSLAFAIVTARMYPTVKYAMGHGRACTCIVVNGAPVTFNQTVAAAPRS